MSDDIFKEKTGFVQPNVAPIFSLNVSQFESLMRPIIQRAVTEAVLAIQPPADLEPPDEMTLQEAADMLQRSKPTLYRWTSRREIPYAMRDGRVVFSRKALREWVASRTIERPQLSDVVDNHLKKVAQNR